MTRKTFRLLSTDLNINRFINFFAYYQAVKVLIADINEAPGEVMGLRARH